MTKSNVRVSMLAVCCGLALSLISCERDTPTTTAVKTGARDLNAMSSGGSAPAPQATRDKTYQTVESTVTKASGSAEGPEKGAAMLLASSSQAGLAATPLTDVSEIDAEGRSVMGQIEAAITRWSVASSIAAAAEAFDPTPQLQRVATAKKEKDAAIASETSRRAALEKQLAELRARAKDKMTQADAKFAEYSRLMESTTQMTATNAEPVVERANKIRMQGERLRVEGAKIEAEADSVQPQFDEVTAIVAQLTKQRQDLDAVEADLNRQTAEARDQASKARAAAAEIASQIRKDADELDGRRSSKLGPAFDAAEKQLKSTQRSATEAAKTSPSAGRAAVGSSHVALAEVAWTRAISAQGYAALLESLTRVAPPLPGVEDYKARLDKAREERTASLAAASSSLDSAIQTFQSVQGPAAVKERMEALGKLLEDAKKLANNERLDSTSPLAPPPWLQTSGQPATQSAGTPEALVEQIVAAMKEQKPAKMFAFVKFNTPEAKEAAKAFEDLAAKIEHADAVHQAKFNTKSPVSADLASFGGGMSMPGMAVENLSAASFKVTTTGDTADATAEGFPLQLHLVKVDGEWKWEMPGADMLPMAAQMLAVPLSSLIDTWTTDVEKGVYADEAAAAQGWKEKSEPVLGPIKAMMQGGMGGGR